MKRLEMVAKPLWKNVSHLLIIDIEMIDTAKVLGVLKDTCSVYVQW